MTSLVTLQLPSDEAQVIVDNLDMQIDATEDAKADTVKDPGVRTAEELLALCSTYDRTLGILRKARKQLHDQCTG